MVEVGVYTHIEDVAGLFVEYRLGQAKGRDLRTHHATGFVPFVVQVYLVAQGCQVAGYGQGGRATADQRYLFAVAVHRHLRHARRNFALVVGRYTLEAADSHRLLRLVEPAAPAGGLTGSVAGATQNAGEYVGLPVDHIGVSIPAGCNQPYIFRYRGMRGAGVLAVDYLVEIFRIPNVCWLHGKE